MEPLERIKAEIAKKISASEDELLLKHVLDLLDEKPKVELDSDMLKSIEKGRRDIANGRSYTLDEFKNRLEAWKGRSS